MEKSQQRDWQQTLKTLITLFFLQWSSLLYALPHAQAVSRNMPCYMIHHALLKNNRYQTKLPKAFIIGWPLHLGSRSKNTKPRRWKLNEMWTQHLFHALPLTCACMDTHVMSEHTTSLSRLPLSSWCQFILSKIATAHMTWGDGTTAGNCPVILCKWPGQANTTISALPLSPPSPRKKQTKIFVSVPFLTVHFRGARLPFSFSD